MYIRKHGIVAIVVWAYSFKIDEFYRFTVMVRLVEFSRVSKVSRISRARVSVMIRISFSFSDRIGI